MTDGTPTPRTDRPPRRRIGLRVLLFVSLALNLVVLGIIGGAILNFSRGEDHPRMVARELGLGPYLVALDPEQSRSLDRVARERRTDLREARGKWKQSFAGAIDIVRSDPFDAAAFRARMLEQAELAASGRNVGIEVMTDLLREMSPEDRKAFADRLQSQARFAQPDHPQRGRGGPHGPQTPGSQDN